MSQRYKVVIAYDGTNFSGFQRQPHRRTVESVLTKVVNQIAKNPTPAIEVFGSGRTDAGVHAHGQVIHFDLPKPLPARNLQLALNSMFPLDMTVKSVELVDDDFHSRFSTHGKRYRYIVSNTAFVDPFKRNFTGHYKYPLDVSKMQQAAPALVGEHDFTSFVASGSQAQSNVRTIYAITIHADEAQHEVTFDFYGSGFLYNQVRIMVAVLLEVGNGRRAVDSLPAVLAGKDRELARETAPASGLYLEEVVYEKPPLT
ncbi:tRNA pseudouridine(38-40) synthase TruA [Furfurilactobacillus sp. WILCCON 0119]|uniref:tRNA pseudouridine(38-40) synthase TruA n=1 Tax=Furfurilactobacillus entadae TaxID=2922307 RepID=UPI0035ED8173